MTDSAVATISATEDLETLRAAVGPDLNNSELKLAILYAQKIGADLFARQIYPTKIDGRVTFISSIDFMRVVAQRSGEYRGQGRVVYEEGCTCEGEGLKLDIKHPVWAEVPIHREGFTEPVVRRAYFHEYAVLMQKGDGWVYKPTWRKMPHVMIAKCSEALALRVAFPNDLAGLYASEEMEQATEGDRADAGRLTAGDIPPEPDLPFETKFVGAVMANVDGIRIVKAPDWYKGDTDKGKVDKLEVQIRVGRSKHTAILMGPSGESLIAAVDEAKLREGEQVAVAGTYHEYQWSDDPKKPKAKQIRAVARVAVLRDNVWHELDVLEGEATEVAEAATEDPSAPSSPRSPATAKPEAPAPEARSASAPESGSTPSAASATETPTTSVEAPSSTPEGTTATADMTEAAEAIFGDMLDDADVDPARGGSAEIPDPMTMDVWSGNPSEGIDLANAVILAVEPKQTVRTGKPYVELWFKHPERPVRFHGFMQGDEAKAQGVYGMGPGEIVRVVGTWMANAGDIFVVLTAVQP